MDIAIPNNFSFYLHFSNETLFDWLLLVENVDDAAEVGCCETLIFFFLKKKHVYEKLGFFEMK